MHHFIQSISDAQYLVKVNMKRNYGLFMEKRVVKQ